MYTKYVYIYICKYMYNFNTYIYIYKHILVNSNSSLSWIKAIQINDSTWPEIPVVSSCMYRNETPFTEFHRMHKPIYDQLQREMAQSVWLIQQTSLDSNDPTRHSMRFSKIQKWHDLTKVESYPKLTICSKVHQIYDIDMLDFSPSRLTRKLFPTDLDPWNVRRQAAERASHRI